MNAKERKHADNKFDSNQMSEIREGFENGLTIEQVKLYANPKFNWKQMQEIRLGFENGLTEEQVKIYADPKFDWWQMQQIRWGFEHGLTEEQINFYANIKYDWSQMVEIRLGFENGLTEEKIKIYADPKFNGRGNVNKKNKILEKKLTLYKQNASKELAKYGYKCESEDVAKLTKPSYYDTGLGMDLMDYWLTKYYPIYVIYFCMFNAERYLQRAGKKENLINELYKVVEYCNRGLDIIAKQNRGEI